MDKKTLLAVVLSVMVLFTYQTFFAPKKPVTAPKAAPAGESVNKNGSPSPVQEQNPTLKAELTATPSDIKEKEITVNTRLYQAVFTTKGGTLKSFRLKNYRKTQAKDAELIELVHVMKGMPGPLAVSFPESDIAAPADAMYEAETTDLDLIKMPKQNRLTLSRTYPSQMKVEKIFTFSPDGYNLELEVRVHNLSTAPINQKAMLSWHEYVDPAKESDSYSHDGPVVLVAKSIEREDVKEIEKEKLYGPNVSWGGFESKYFIAAMVPQNPSLTSLAVSKDGNNMVSTSLKGQKNPIPVGQAGLFSYTLFLGPKDYSILKTLRIGLEDAIDFGSWMKWLAMPMLIFLKYINNLVNNYGLAIIILTILIKIIFWPLGNKSYRSMKEMQKLQPKMQELREKYKDDKQRIGQETMALYKAHKVNPMGGCLPMVIQIPVFFGLYKTLLYAIELRHAPFFWWLQDLSDKDPYYITPIIMGITMFAQQKMSPQAGDPMQQKVMLLMPVIFTVLFLNFPSGLVIYWLFNNILSIGQQYFIIKQK